MTNTPSTDRILIQDSLGEGKDAEMETRGIA